MWLKRCTECDIPLKSAKESVKTFREDCHYCRALCAVMFYSYIIHSWSYQRKASVFLNKTISRVFLRWWYNQPSYESDIFSLLFVCKVTRTCVLEIEINHLFRRGELLKKLESKRLCQSDGLPNDCFATSCTKNISCISWSATEERAKIIWAIFVISFFKMRWKNFRENGFVITFNVNKHRQKRKFGM